MKNIKESVRMLLEMLPIGLWLIILTIASWVFGWRLYSRNSSGNYRVQRMAVNSNWGGSVKQYSPKLDVSMVSDERSPAMYTEAEKISVKNTRIVRSKVNADLNMDYRRKGLSYYPTFVTQFEGEYVVKNESKGETRAKVMFPLPAQGNLVWDVSVEEGGGAEGSVISTRELSWNGVMKAGEEKTIKVKYMARGLEEFSYSLGASEGLQDFELKVNVNGAEQIDFPQGSLSPVSSAEDKENKKWSLVWKFDKVLTSPEITVRTFSKQNISSSLAKLFLVAPMVLTMFVLVLLGIGVYQQKQMARFDLWLNMTIYSMFYPLLAYVVSVFEKVNLYQGLAISGGVVSLILLMFYRYLWGARTALSLGVLTQAMFVFFFPLAMLIPQITGLMSVIGVIVILAAVVKMRMG